jgi:hypothetical protein
VTKTSAETCRQWCELHDLSFHSPAAEDSRILGCDIVSLGTSLPVCWSILLPSSPWVKHPRTPLKKIAQWSSKTGGITHQRHGVIPHNTWILNHLNHFSVEDDRGSDNKSQYFDFLSIFMAHKIRHYICGSFFFLMILIWNNLFTTRGVVINNSDSCTVQCKTKSKGTRSTASLILKFGTRCSLWSNSCTSYFTPVEWTHSTHWDGPTASLSMCKRPCWEPCCTLTVLCSKALSHICKVPLHRSTHTHTHTHPQHKNN